VLGYFIDVCAPTLLTFLAEQRHSRIDRVRQMVDKLSRAGVRLDAEAILKPALEDSGKSAGRAWIARALVAAGYVATTDEAFRRWLERGKPAFVARRGASPEEVFERIHRASGIASLAHPALVGRDEWIPAFVADGLDALEAYHSEHDAETTKRYLAMAGRLGVAVSGGSDYHADETHGAVQLGSVSVPSEAYERLVQLKSSTGGKP
jgi:predicted metal-dependent phosphoesterase TrpH